MPNITCKFCDENVYKKHVDKNTKFCSKICQDKSRKNKITLPCLTCGKLVERVPSSLKKTNNNAFCNHACAAKYMNAHKTTGTRVSKLEIYLQEQLVLLYPNINFHFNRKDTINSELDIYLPDYKLAFELNGIFHYEPIYGHDKLSQIQNNDTRKFQACLENNIELVIIDSSSLGYLKKDKADKYLKIITDIINLKLCVGCSR